MQIFLPNSNRKIKERYLNSLISTYSNNINARQLDSHDLTDIINTVKTPNTKLVLLIEKNKLPKDPIGDAYWAPVKHTNFKSMPRGDEDDIMRALQNGDGDLYGY